MRDAVRQTVEQEARERARPHVAYSHAPAGVTPYVADAAPSAALARMLDHLRSTVWAYVRGRRTEGTAIERVLPEVKCLVREAASCEQWHDPADALMAQVVRWTIDAYYDQPDLQHVPRFY